MSKFFEAMGIERDDKEKCMNWMLRGCRELNTHQTNFEKVNQLAPLFSNPQTCEQTLRQQVSEMVGSGARLPSN